MCGEQDMRLCSLTAVAWARTPERSLLPNTRALIDGAELYPSLDGPSSLRDRRSIFRREKFTSYLRAPTRIFFASLLRVPEPECRVTREVEWEPMVQAVDPRRGTRIFYRDVAAAISRRSHQRLRRFVTGGSNGSINMRGVEQGAR